MRPYRNATWIDGYDAANLDKAETKDRSVSRELQSIGLGSDWKSGKESTKEPNGNTSLWSALDSEIDLVRDKLVLLTEAVILFVAALGCLTFAELWRHNP